VKFFYLGTKLEGDPVQGEIEADSPTQATSILGLQDIRVTHLSPVRAVPKLALKRGVTSTDIATFCEQLAGLTAAEHPLPDALAALSRDASKPALRRALDRVAAGLDAGDNLADLLERESKVFPPLLPAVVRAGEASGNLPETLRMAASHTWRTSALRDKVTAAMAYPAIVLVFMCIIGSLVFTFVTPEFDRMFKELGVSLPYPTAAMLFIGRHFRVGALGFLVLMLLVIWAFRYLHGPGLWWSVRRFVMFHIPIIGRALKAMYLAQFCRLMRVLLVSGGRVDDALVLHGRLWRSSPLIRNADAMAEAVRKGERLSVAMSKPFGAFPDMLVWMVQSCETTGRLPDAFGEAAEVFERDAERNSQVAGTLLPGVLVIVVGSIIALAIAALFLPFVTIMQSIS